MRQCFALPHVEGSTYEEVAAARTRVVRAELEKLGYLPAAAPK